MTQPFFDFDRSGRGGRGEGAHGLGREISGNGEICQNINKSR